MPCGSSRLDAPSKVAEAPYAKLAGAIVSAWPGWFGCSATNSSAELPGGLCTADGEEPSASRLCREAGDCSCLAGNVDGGTVWAFDTSDLDMQNFGIPLLVLLHSLKKRKRQPRQHMRNLRTGTSSVTTYGESMAGVYEGGRTGLTALWIALFNFLSMFFAPLFGSIPTLSTGPPATAMRASRARTRPRHVRGCVAACPALIMVGVFMAEGLGTIDWHDYMQASREATYKIEAGLVAGLRTAGEDAGDVGILAGLMTLAMIKILTLRIVFNLPRGYESMPPLIQRFLKRQSLNAYERGIIAAAEGKPSAEA
ncbi:hypothetical protein EMIHUDRAFT_223534 [Emiliania huxleyi CCMP1516]|uniref:Uncharacterized protein n=2 Tax=Emiliania huxleyi TaxID=2903 RepID=A0A0D3KUB4_EMIH1|nr:hypothetical protein EMIHUDRAFT_223534 [Emiliania huxleyi CCMP1516]EOD39349.1 hypothetical protein EMIHUDRAFT_223534 [Emiliania huxleyi CCMP1516]|eukprot:XP_005791778.1 hypothetical protein EMIHUDRAFT_223534 [Emiliania huxleyi CCMP1516]